MKKITPDIQRQLSALQDDINTLDRMKVRLHQRGLDHLAEHCDSIAADLCFEQGLIVEDVGPIVTFGGRHER